jgi:diguanylate cyclase (GGDEF)-like protein/PAS domain S-box-containing protein
MLIEQRVRARHELQTTLTELGHTAQAFGDIALAVERARSSEFDVVLLGGLPDVSRYIEELRALHISAVGTPLRTAAVLDDGDEGMQTELLHAGFDEVLIPPVTFAELGGALARLQHELARSENPDALDAQMRRPIGLLMQLFELAQDGYLLADGAGRILAANPAFERLSGYRADEVAGQTLQGAGLVLEADAHRRTSGSGSGLLGSLAAPVEFTLVTKDWKHIPVELQTSPLRVARQACLLGVVRSMSGRNREVRRRTDAALAQLSDSVSDGVLALSSEGVVRFASPAAAELLGLEPDALAGTWLQDLLQPADRPALQGQLSGTSEERWRRRLTRVLLGAGMHRDLLVSVASVASVASVENGAVLDGAFVTLLRPEEPVREAEAVDEPGLASVGFYSLYDAVTALPNRLLFLDRLDHGLERAARYQHLLAVFVIEIEGVPELNLRYGNAAGDQALSEVGLRIHRCLREGDTAARIGGAEFAVLAEGVGGVAEGRLLADKLLETLRAPHAIDDAALQLRASIGLTLGAQESRNAGALLREAQAAAAIARRHGGDRCITQREVPRGAIVPTALDLNGDLRRAVEHGELCLHYQPEVDLHTGEIIGAEALLRWEHPRHGLILPGEFIALAEGSGFISGIGRWALERATLHVADWRKRYRSAAGMMIAVNVSPLQLRDPSFVEQVKHALLRANLPPTALRLETSGAAVLSSDAILLSALVALRQLGVHVALQGVDADAWDMEQIAEIPADTIKIDRSLVGSVVANHARPSLRQPLLAYAETAGFEVVVSSIETAQHLARARIFKHRHGQGFYFFRPVPARSMETILGRGALPGALDAPEGRGDALQPIS